MPFWLVGVGGVIFFAVYGSVALLSDRFESPFQSREQKT